MKQNSDKAQEKEPTFQYQKQVDSAIDEACEQYQQHRDKAQKQIDQGARITEHRIKL